MIKRGRSWSRLPLMDTHMSEHTLDYIKKLMLLERAAGTNVQYAIMTPPDLRLDETRSNDAPTEGLGWIISGSAHNRQVLHDTARLIADFMGMSAVSVNIDIVEQKEHIAATVNVGHFSDSVAIRIGGSLFRHPQCVVATLSHELCHKWLDIYRITLPNKDEEEILT